MAVALGRKQDECFNIRRELLDFLNNMEVVSDYAIESSEDDTISDNEEEEPYRNKE